MSEGQIELEHVSTDIILREQNHVTGRITFQIKGPGIGPFITTYVRLELNALVEDPIKTLSQSGFGVLFEQFQGKTGVKIDQEFYRKNLGLT